MASELKRISLAIQRKKNVDAELWRYYGRSPSDPNSIFNSPDRALKVTALCSLVTTTLDYNVSSVLEAVVATGSNPKLAYMALSWIRLRIRPLSDHPDSVFRLLMMLDEAHLAKSPVNRLPGDFWFLDQQVEQLSKRFPTVQWQCRLPATPRFESVEDLVPLLKQKADYGRVAVLGQPMVKKLLAMPLPDPFKLLCQSRLHDKRALTQLKKSNDWLLVAHGVSLWLSNTPEFVECPASWQFDQQWTQFISAVMPKISKADSFAVFEQPPMGLVVLWSFFTIVRPPQLPKFSPRDPLQRVWGQLFGYLFSNVLDDPLLVKTSLPLLSATGKLLALDVLMRTDPDPSLAAQFVALYQDGLVDPEPVLALMLQRGLVEHAHALAKTQNLPPPPKKLKPSPEFLVRAIHDAPAASIAPLLKQLIAESPIATTISLFEKLVPLINTLSIRGNGAMVKLEYASLSLHALLMLLYVHVGFRDGASQLQQAGASRAAGLNALIWKGVFEDIGLLADLVPLVARLKQELESICNFAPDPQDIVTSIKLLHSRTRRDVLLSTLNDTVYMFPESCGFKQKLRRAFDPTEIVQKWHLLSTPMSGKGLTKNSQLIVDNSPTISALGGKPEPWFSLAADNMRSPLLHMLAETSHKPLHVREGEIVVGLNFSSDKSALIVSRSLASGSTTVQIPVYRPTAFSDDTGTFCVQDSISELANLIKKSTTLSRTQFAGSTDEWWRQQKRYGKKIRECLIGLEQRLFGGLIGLFSPISLSGSQLLAQARQEILKLYARYVDIPIPVLNGIKDEVIELFMEIAKQQAMGSPLKVAVSKSMVSDLNGFVLDGLRLAGYPIDYDMIDTIELEHALLTLACSFRLPDIQQHHLVIVPDHEMVSIPWESLPYFENHESTSRCMSQWHYMDLVERSKGLKAGTSYSDSDTEADEPSAPRDPLSTNVQYVLNPQRDLPAAEEMFRQDFSNWSGFTGQEPSERQIISLLQSSSCYIYIGHGSGYRLIRSSSIRKLDQCSPVMLFGCSSAKLQAGAGPALDFIIGGCKLFLGFMWDIPNTDCNLFTYEFIKLCFEERLGVFKALKQARKVCRIYTTSLAAVAYGIP